MPLDDFEFDGYRASEYGVKMSAPFSLDGATPSYISNAKILGRNGNLLEWDGSYQNRRGYASCFILASDAIEKFDQFVSGLVKSPEYKRLMVDSIPDAYLMAAVTTPPQAQFRNMILNPFDITFTCKPQKFLLSGEETVTFSQNGTLTNPSDFAALPLLTIYGSGSGSITIGGTKISIKSLTDQITIDCDTQNAYRKVGEGSPENKNSTITAPEFPTLKSGDNSVIFDGGVTKIDIVPRWWKL